MIHDYFGIDVELIWSVVESLLPELRAEVQLILDGLSPEGGTA